MLAAALLFGGRCVYAEEHPSEPARGSEVVVVQPPAGRVMTRPRLATQRPATARHVAPLRFTAQPDQPLPLPAPSKPREPAAPHEPAGDFQPIGTLSASVAVGTSAADAEVSGSDRPEDTLDHPEWIAVSRGVPLPAWPSLSPLKSISHHQPLYFEDANLERYGTSKHPRLQPLRSAAHFGLSAATLPYQMALQRPHREYRYRQPFEAGRFGYRQRTLPPPDGYATAAQAAVILGLVFVLP